MRKRIILAAAVLLGLALPGAAAAATGGYTTGNVNMRAGPGTQYPPVTVVPRGSSVTIHGCTSGYSWCDTQWAGYRGWVSGSYLEFVYQQRRVLVPNYGPAIGLPIIAFSIGDYWGRYYRHYPWWNDWGRWAPPPPRRIAPPPPRGPIVGPGPGPRPGPGPGPRPPLPGPGPAPRF
ncbi:SH3 domain-containing protein [Faunimonas sp. B44]|uniref:SH3 domain-containing protein n=1 Tax=Faunimonas sp. B44 TaxID=3461493 RepID=UPI004043C84C